MVEASVPCSSGGSKLAMSLAALAAMTALTLPIVLLLAIATSEVNAVQGPRTLMHEQPAAATTDVHDDNNNRRDVGEAAQLSVVLNPLRWKQVVVQTRWEKAVFDEKYSLTYTFDGNKTNRIQVETECPGVVGDPCFNKVEHVLDTTGLHTVQVQIDRTFPEKEKIATAAKGVEIPENITECSLEYDPYVAVDRQTAIRAHLEPNEALSRPTAVVWSGFSKRPINTTSLSLDTSFNASGLVEMEAYITNTYSKCLCQGSMDVQAPIVIHSTSTSVAGNATHFSIEVGKSVAFSCAFSGSRPLFLWTVGDSHETLVVEGQCDLTHVFNKTGNFDISLEGYNHVSATQQILLNVTVTAAPPPSHVAPEIVTPIVLVVVGVVLILVIIRYRGWLMRLRGMEVANHSFVPSKEKRRRGFLNNRHSQQNYGTVEMFEL